MTAMDFHLNKRVKAHPSSLYGLGNFPKKDLCCFNGIIYRKEDYT